MVRENRHGHSKHWKRGYGWALLIPVHMVVCTIWAVALKQCLTLHFLQKTRINPWTTRNMGSNPIRNYKKVRLRRRKASGCKMSLRKISGEKFVTKKCHKKRCYLVLWAVPTFEWQEFHGHSSTVAKVICEEICGNLKMWMICDPMDKLPWMNTHHVTVSVQETNF